MTGKRSRYDVCPLHPGGEALIPSTVFFFRVFRGFNCRFEAQSFPKVLWRWLGCVPLLLGLCAVVLQVEAAERRFQIQLIWGSNGEKPKEQSIKPVDPKLRARLTDVFKWQDYYEITRQSVAVPDKGSKRLRLSDKCEVQVVNAGGSKVEVQLFGEGKAFSRANKQSIRPNELLVLGGDEKNRSAWMVVVTALE